MPDTYIDSRGMNLTGHLMLEYCFNAIEPNGRHLDNLTHTNYAENLGVGLYLAHQWIQHKHGWRPEHYTITRVRRRLRWVTDQGVRYPTDNYVELTDWHRANPVTPPFHPPKPEIQAPDMPFMGDVPVQEKTPRKGNK